MVNTFLVSPDFATSASLLDSVRLNKQILEATQILTILQDLNTIADYFEWDPIPRGQQTWKLFRSQCNWIKETRARYLKCKFRLVWIKVDGKLALRKWIKEKTLKTRKIDKSVPFTICTDGNVIVESVTLPRNRVFIAKEGERAILLGFSQHPIVEMWAGSEDALKAYINAHIATWRMRTRKNGELCKTCVPTHVLPDAITYPWWIYHSDLIASHKISLLRKERDRDEPQWYWKLAEFRDYQRSLDVDYVWVNKLEESVVNAAIKKRHFW